MQYSSIKRRLGVRLRRGVMCALWATLAVFGVGNGAVAQSGWTAHTVNDTSYWLLVALHFDDAKEPDGWRFLNHSTSGVSPELSVAQSVSSGSVWGYRTSGVSHAYQLGFTLNGSTSFLAWGQSIFEDGELKGRVALLQDIGVTVYSQNEISNGLGDKLYFYNRTAGTDGACRRYAYNVIVYDKSDNTFKRQTFYNYLFLDEGDLYYYGSYDGSSTSANDTTPYVFSQSLNSAVPNAGSSYRRYLTWIRTDDNNFNTTVKDGAQAGEYVQVYTSSQSSVGSGRGYFRLTSGSNVSYYYYYRTNGNNRYTRVSKNGGTWCKANPFMEGWRDDYIDINTMVRSFRVRRNRMDSVSVQGGYTLSPTSTSLWVFNGSNTVRVNGSDPIVSTYSYDRYRYNINQFDYRNASGNNASARYADTAFYRYVNTDGTTVETHTRPWREQILPTTHTRTLMNRRWYLTGEAADYLRVESEFSLLATNRVVYDKQPSPTRVTGRLNVVNIYDDGTTDTMRATVTAGEILMAPSAIVAHDDTVERGRTAEVGYHFVGGLPGFPDYDAFVDINWIDYEIVCTAPDAPDHHHTVFLNGEHHTYRYIPGTNDPPTITGLHDGSTRIIVTARYFDEEDCWCYKTVSDTAMVYVIPDKPEIHVNGLGYVYFTPSDANPDCPDSIYYTTDGTPPQVMNRTPQTASTKLFVANGGAWEHPSNVVGPFGVGTVIRAAVFCNGERSRDSIAVINIFSGQYNDHPGVGVDSTTILNDYEDHNWAYYSQTDNPVKSLYPRNVRVYYEGNGKVFTGNDVTAPLMTQSGGVWTNKSGVADVASGTVGLGIDHPTMHRFIYLKTLERVEGAAADGSNDYFVYTTIPNPFSRRPKVATDATTAWRGFVGWMVDSVAGGTISGYNVGDVIPANEKINILPTDRTRTNANNDINKQVTIRLKAVWGRAYRVAVDASSISSNLNSSILSGSTYERNFLVVTGGKTTSFSPTRSKNVTITMVEPDGSIDYRRPSVFVAGDFTCQASTKFEYINIANGTKIDTTASTLPSGATALSYNFKHHREVKIYRRQCTEQITRTAQFSRDKYLRNGVQVGDSTSTMTHTRTITRRRLADSRTDIVERADRTTCPDTSMWTVNDASVAGTATWGTITWGAALEGQEWISSADTTWSAETFADCSLGAFEQVGTSRVVDEWLTGTSSTAYTIGTGAVRSHTTERFYTDSVRTQQGATVYGSTATTTLTDDPHDFGTITVVYGDPVTTIDEPSITSEAYENNMREGMQIWEDGAAYYYSCPGPGANPTKNYTYQQPLTKTQSMVQTDNYTNIHRNVYEVSRQSVSQNYSFERTANVYRYDTTDTYTLVSVTYQKSTGTSHGTFTANAKDLIFGRGVQHPSVVDSTCVNYVRGINADTTNPQYTIRLESGTINHVSLAEGCYKASSSYEKSNHKLQGTIGIKCVLGCDYDRSKNDGRSGDLNIVKNVIMGLYMSALGDRSPYTPDRSETCNIWVKSGRVGSSVDVVDGVLFNAFQTLYACIAGDRVEYTGRRNLYIEGGELSGVAGGIDGYFNSTEDVSSSNTLSGGTYSGETAFYLKMSGGRVRGVIYGGGAKSPADGDRTMIFTGGVVDGWIGAGCNGTDDKGGMTYGASHIYFGGTSHCGGENSSVKMNGSCGGHLFAAGKGYASETGTSGEMTYGTQLVLADSCVVDSNVYGGGNYGYAKMSTVVRMYGGTVGGSLFGGANLKQGPNVDIKISGGIVKGGVYGGSNTNGTLGKENNEAGNVSIVMSGGQVGVDANHTANIHGGGYGQNTKVKGNVDITVSDSAVVYGDVYGGSALGSVNSNATTYSSTRHTTVNIAGGTVNGSVYGGGLGNSTTAAHVYAPVTVNITGGKIYNVFGCNNVNGMPQGPVVVNIDSTATGTFAQINNVYGGGNQAAYGSATNNADLRVNMTGGHVTENIFGGGLGSTAINSKGTKVKITGHHSVVDGSVYGGGSEAKVVGNTEVTVGNED